MGRKNTSARATISDLCYSYRLDEQWLFNCAFLLLDSYRKLCYTCYLDNDECDESDYSEKNPREAIDFLVNMETDMDQKDFVRTIRERADKNWIKEIVESAMIKVQEFPEYGKLYYEVLNKRFVVQWGYSEPEIYSTLCIERSRYYDRRREAVTVFGLCLWGSVIPNLIKELDI